MPNILGGWTTDQIYCDIIDSQYGDTIFRKVVRECVIRKLINIEEATTLSVAEKALSIALINGYDSDIDRIIKMIFLDSSGKGSRGVMMPSGDILVVLTNQWTNILKKYQPIIL
jgi:hypothetical protein